MKHADHSDPVLTVPVEYDMGPYPERENPGQDVVPALTQAGMIAELTKRFVNFFDIGLSPPYAPMFVTESIDFFEVCERPGS